MKDTHKAILLGVCWFLIGGFAYATLAVTTLVLNMGGLSTPPPAFRLALSFTLFGLPFPMVFGWVPAVYRLVRGRPGPWVSALVMGAIAVLLPILCVIVLGATR